MMDEQAANQEPWERGKVSEGRVGLWTPDGHIAEFFYDEDEEPTFAEIDRCIECRNALCGIADPAAFVEAAKEQDRYIRALKEKYKEITDA